MLCLFGPLFGGTGAYLTVEIGRGLNIVIERGGAEGKMIRKEGARAGD